MLEIEDYGYINHKHSFKTVNPLWPRQDGRHVCRRQMHFLQWKYLNLNENFTDVCSQGSNSQYASIGSDNALVPNRRQTIIWTNDDLGYQYMYASLGLNGINEWCMCASVMAQSHHTPWAIIRPFTGPLRPRAVPYEFSLPERGP